MYLVGLHIYYKMIHGPYNVKLKWDLDIQYLGELTYLMKVDTVIFGTLHYLTWWKSAPLFSSKKNETVYFSEISVNFSHPARCEIQEHGVLGCLTIYFCCFNSRIKPFVFRSQETHFNSSNLFPLLFVLA